MTAAIPSSRSISRPRAAVAGLVAGGAALGASELVAGLLPGGASLVVAIGDAVISLQPPGAKQLVVDIFGEADKLALELLVVAVALAAAAWLGTVARTRPGAARVGYAAFALLALGAALLDPLTEALPTVATAAAAALVASLTLDGLLRLARGSGPPVAEMPDWDRRRFLGTSIAVGGVALGAGWLGRSLLARGGAGATPQAGSIPAPSETAPPPPAGAQLDGIEGLTPLVTPTERFYRIDTALLVPRPNLDEWRLRITGLVNRPFELTYDELTRMELHEQYVTIACVSNEVGGDLVGNALWTGVPLKVLLDRAGLQPGATQIVGRAVDGFTVGFPTVHALAEGRESLVAVAMNREPLPADHGYPARLIVPGLFGYVSATKWLAEIELTTLDAFDAYWIPLGWAKDGPILTQSRIDVPRDGAQVDAGTLPIAGVAWAPDRGIRAVEVQVDDGEWMAAELSTPISDGTWVQFVRRWEAVPGEHVIRVRATDGDGVVQTDRRTPPPPDGARGHHAVRVRVG